MRRLFFLLLALSATAVFAQTNRSFVSVTGSDANDCTAGHECRSFARAISVTNSGGEILAISSGGYGPFTVDRAITVAGAPGVNASITAASGDGVAIAVSAAVVVLRGLNVTLTGTSGNGFHATAFSELSIESCTTKGGDIGMLIAGDNTSHTTITDSSVLAAGTNGYFIQSRAAVLRSRVTGSGLNGLKVVDGTASDGRVSAVDVVAVHNGLNGIEVISNTGGHAIEASIARAVSSNNAGDGLFVRGFNSGSALALISDSIVTNNIGFGLNVDNVDGGQLASMNNNFVAGNGADTNGAIGTVTAH